MRKKFGIKEKVVIFAARFEKNGMFIENIERLVQASTENNFEFESVDFFRENVVGIGQIYIVYIQRRV